MTNNAKIAIAAVCGLVVVLIVGMIVAKAAIDHSSTTRNGKAIEAAQPKTTNDLFCWLYHNQLADDPTTDPVELANVVLAGKAKDHTVSLGVYQIASGRPPEALEPSFDQFTSMVTQASQNKPVDRDALLQVAQSLHVAIVRQCTPEHSTTTSSAALTNESDTVPATS